MCLGVKDPERSGPFGEYGAPSGRGRADARLVRVSEIRRGRRKVADSRRHGERARGRSAGRASTPVALILALWACLPAPHASAQLATSGSQLADNWSVGNAADLISGERNYPNWSDLLFAPIFVQSFGYNSNVLGAPASRALPLGLPHGGAFSLTLLGASSKTYLDGQDFTFNGNFGTKNYFEVPSYNTTQYQLDVGMDWRAASLCKGVVSANASKYQQPLDELLAPGINTVYHNTASISGGCRLVENLNFLFGGTAVATRSSAVTSAANDNNTYTATVGVEYAPSEIYSMSVISDITERIFDNRQLSSLDATAGTLSRQLVQLDHKAQYKRALTDKVSIALMVGLTQVENTTTLSGGGLGEQNVPIYAALVQWTITPKLLVAVSTGQSVGSPLSVIANEQITQSTSLQITYVVTPKLVLQAGVTKSSNSTGQSGPTVTDVAGVEVGNSFDSLSAQASFVYYLTPFLQATGSAQWFRRTSTSYGVTGALFMAGVSYRPY